MLDWLKQKVDIKKLRHCLSKPALVAGNVYKWGLATDLGLLAAEAMLDAGAVKEGTEMIKVLQSECEAS